MKVWLCYMNAGGGHKAPAQALARAMKEIEGGNIQPELINLADEASFFLRYLVEDGYVWMIHNIPILYALIYELSLLKPLIALEHKLGVLFLKKKLKQRILTERPDMIVATFFLVEAIRQILKELNLTTPFYIVVTEPYSTPLIWFHAKELPYIVLSDRAKKIAERCGVKNVYEFDPIVNNPLKHGLSSAEKKNWREKLQLDPNKKIILLIGGGAGLPGGEKTLKAFTQSSLDAQCVVVCGNNDDFKNKMTKISASSNKKICIFGFVDFVPELIALSDLVVTKAGGGVIAEVMAQNKPILITHYIYGQEKGTMEHVIAQGIGWYETDPKVAIQKIAQFFDDSSGQKEMAVRYEKLSLKSGNLPIAKFLLSQVQR